MSKKQGKTKDQHPSEGDVIVAENESFTIIAGFGQGSLAGFLNAVKDHISEQRQDHDITDEGATLAEALVHNGHPLSAVVVQGLVDEVVQLRERLKDHEGANVG